MFMPVMTSIVKVVAEKETNRDESILKSSRIM